MELPYDLEIPRLGIYPTKELKAGNLYLYVYSSVIHHSPKVETAQMSIARWIDKPTTVCACNAIFIQSSRGMDGVLIHATTWIKMVCKAKEARHKETSTV